MKSWSDWMQELQESAARRDKRHEDAAVSPENRALHLVIEEQVASATKVYGTVTFDAFDRLGTDIPLVFSTMGDLWFDLDFFSEALVLRDGDGTEVDWIPWCDVRDFSGWALPPTNNTQERS